VTNTERRSLKAAPLSFFWVPVVTVCLGTISRYWWWLPRLTWRMWQKLIHNLTAAFNKYLRIRYLLFT